MTCVSFTPTYHYLSNQDSRYSSDFSTWTKWSPWLIAEPGANVTVSTDPSSVGSTYAWDGEVVGAGQLTHEKLESGTFIDDRIQFFRPFKSTNRVTFEFADGESGGTRVTWNMYASLPFFMFWMTGMMKSMISMDYDRGLKMLKEWIETDSIRAQLRSMVANRFPRHVSSAPAAPVT